MLHNEYWSKAHKTLLRCIWAFSFHRRHRFLKVGLFFCFTANSHWAEAGRASAHVMSGQICGKPVQQKMQPEECLVPSGRRRSAPAASPMATVPARCERVLRPQRSRGLGEPQPQVCLQLHHLPRGHCPKVRAPLPGAPSEIDGPVYLMKKQLVWALMKSISIWM